MKWNRVRITSSLGPRDAVAPLVISASRATDIPAFHAPWIMNRLRAGYCAWVNPFNRRQTQYVSFEAARVIVFWSKNPEPLLPHMPAIADMGYQFYFQFALNDYEKENLEPGVPPLARRIDTFRRLADLIGRERVVWRYSPVIVGRNLDLEEQAGRIQRIGERISDFCEAMTFSFTDILPYKKVAANLGRSGGDFRELEPAEKERFARLLRSVNSGWANPLSLAVCADKHDLRPHGIGPNKCIDDRLILRLCPDDEALQTLFGLRTGQLSLLPARAVRPAVKDPGQRPECGCAPSKDIGAYSTCGHGCLYCYANSTPQAGLAGMKRVVHTSEALLS